jgi:ABC-type sulfate transport system substrate-binding protein
MKLISITESTKPDKKLMAVFDNDGRKKTTHFGAKGMDDYTLTKDKEQRDRYRTRHAKDLKSNDPTKAGYLSYYILWGDSTSRAKNITEYKKRFNI